MKKNDKKETASKDIIAEIEKRFERHTGVLMEQMLHEVKTVAEGHGIIIRKLESHDDKFAKLESELNTAKIAVMDTSRRVNQIDKKLNHALDNHEKRLVKLEEKAA